MPSRLKLHAAPPLAFGPRVLPVLRGRFTPPLGRPPIRASRFRRFPEHFALYRAEPRERRYPLVGYYFELLAHRLRVVGHEFRPVAGTTDLDVKALPRGQVRIVRLHGGDHVVEPPACPAFLREVEMFLAVTGIKRSLLGRESTGNPYFVAQLLGGASPSLATVEAVSATSAVGMAKAKPSTRIRICGGSPSTSATG